MIDEFPTLQELKIIQTGITYFRKFGVVLWLICQDIAQIKQHYGETGVSVFLSSPDVRKFYGIKEIDFAEKLSKGLGEKTVREQTYSVNTGTSHASGSASNSHSDGDTISTAGKQISVLTCQEILNMPHTPLGKPESQLIYINNLPCAMVGMAKYFNRREFIDDDGKPIYDDNPFYKKDVDEAKELNVANKAIRAEKAAERRRIETAEYMQSAPVLERLGYIIECAYLKVRGWFVSE